MGEIVAVSRSRRVAITDDGRECSLTNLFDDFGDEIDDVTRAVAAVCQLPDGQWASIDLTQFEAVAVH